MKNKLLSRRNRTRKMYGGTGTDDEILPFMYFYLFEENP
jgi:hypothetical protein